MKAFLNPWVLLAIVGIVAGAFFFGMKVGSDHEVAAQAKFEEQLRQVAESAEAAAARKIGEITIVHKTIQNQTKEIVREETRYRDCVNVPAVERLLDDSRANRKPSEPAGDSSVSGAGPQ